MNSHRGKLLRLYVNEHDQYEGKPLYEAIVARCQELNLAGATAFKAFEGFGGSAELHRQHVFAHDQPIVITVVDNPEKTAHALPILQSMMPGGLIAVTDVDVVAVSKGSISALF